MVTLRDDRWIEQTWIITPLPDGGVEMKGKSHEARRTDSTMQTLQAAETTATTTARRKEQKAENGNRTTVEDRSNSILQILWMWLSGILALMGIGYILVKHQNKKTT